MDRGRSVSVDLSPHLESTRRIGLNDFHESPSNVVHRLVAFEMLRLLTFINSFDRMDRSNTLDFIRSPQSLQNASIGLTKVFHFHNSFVN